MIQFLNSLFIILKYYQQYERYVWYAESYQFVLIWSIEVLIL